MAPDLVFENRYNPWNMKMKNKDLRLSGKSMRGLLPMGPALWRALKHLTEVGSDARRIVTSVPDEDGFLAWSRLNKQYGMQLSAKTGSDKSAVLRACGSYEDAIRHQVEVD